MLKKIILLLILGFVFSDLNAQIEIHDMDGVTAVGASYVVEGDVGPEFSGVGYYLINTTDEVVKIDWERHKLATQECMLDLILTGDGGYEPIAWGDPSIFYSPEPLTIVVGDSMYFKGVAWSNEDPCCAIYNYYFTTEVGVKLDSVEVKFSIGGADCYLSTEVEAEKELISIYPNPATDIVNVFVGSAKDASIRLYNVVGEQVLTATLMEGTNELNVATLPNGVYFYAISENGIVIETKKLVVRH